MHRRRPGATPNRDLPRLDRQISEPPPLANLNVKISIGELCGVAEVRLPSFVNTQAATDGDAMCAGYYASRRCDPRERDQSELDDKRGPRAPFGARRERQYGADDKSAIAIRHSTVPSCWSGS